jgi:glycosyltransferase involved in cell wall biosynthesis
VNDRILWLGERDARGVLAAMDLFAISSRKEGLPYVVLEALATGLPVVATASSGVEILVESGMNGEVIRRDDVDGFAHALIKLVTDSNLRAQYGAAALRHAGNFTVDAMVQRTIAAYASAAPKRIADTKPIHQSMVLPNDLRMEAQLQ